VKDAIKDPKGLITKAMTMEEKDYVDKVFEAKKEAKEKATGVYKHLMTGVSYMIPFVVASGILIAISFAFGIKAFEKKRNTCSSAYGHRRWQCILSHGSNSGWLYCIFDCRQAWACTRNDRWAFGK
jgi:hypothetical protein